MYKCSTYQSQEQVILSQVWQNYLIIFIILVLITEATSHPLWAVPMLECC